MSLIDDILDKTYIDANLGAYHWDRDKTAKNNYNEKNYGLGIEHDTGTWRQMLGQYKNSLHGQSNYALLGYTPLQYETGIGRFRAGIVGGGVTGYPGLPVAPVAGLLGSYDKGRFGLNLIATPSVKMGDKEADGFLGLQGRYKFK